MPSGLPDMPALGLDVSALNPAFKAHSGRGIGRYVSELANYLNAASAERESPEHERLLNQRWKHQTFDQLTLLDGPAYSLLQRLAVAGRTTFRQQMLLPYALAGLRQAGVKLLHFPAHMDAPVWCPFPYIITVLDLIPLACEDLYRADRPNWRFRFARWLEMRAIRQAALILAISEHTARDVQRYLHVDPERIAVTPLGIDRSFFVQLTRQERQEVRARLGIPLERPVVLYVGGIDPRKNWRTLLRTHRELCGAAGAKGHPLPLLVTAGRITADNQYPLFRKLCAELHIEDEVVELGYVDDTHLPSVYAMADVFFFPSIYEGFGLTPLEAMAAGTPVVSSHASCLSEVLGDAALLVDPLNVEECTAALLRVLYGADGTDDLRAHGAVHAAQYTWERTGELTVRAYEQLIFSTAL